MIKYINIILITLCTIVLGGGALNYFYKKSMIEIPNFVYYDLNSKTFSNQDLTSGKKTLIALVSTSCGSCEDFIKEIEVISKQNPEYNYLIVASEQDPTSASHFYKNLLSQNHQLKLLYDRNSNFTTDFKMGIVVQYPSIFLYDEQGNLMKRIESLEELQKFFKD